MMSIKINMIFSVDQLYDTFIYAGQWNKSPTVEHWEAFRKQRNLCVKLFRTEKRNFYKKLNISDITDNKNSGKQLNLSSRIKVGQIQKLPLLKMKKLFPMTKKLQRL